MRRGAIRVVILMGLLAVVAIGCVAVQRTLFGSVPPMDLVPAVPDNAEIVRNETEWSDGAGGNSARVLVFRSASMSPERLADQIAEAFDADARWTRTNRPGPYKEWTLGDPRCAASPIARTSASVEVGRTGESIAVGQFNEFTVDEAGVVVRISTLEHAFCQVGSVVGS